MIHGSYDTAFLFNSELYDSNPVYTNLTRMRQRFFWVSGTTVVVGSLLATGTAHVVSAPSCRIGFATSTAILRIGMFGGCETHATFREIAAYRFINLTPAIDARMLPFLTVVLLQLVDFQHDCVIPSDRNGQ